jgi:predicted transcriptional regulator
MSISQGELDSFHQFARDALSAANTDLNWEQLLERWRERREELETLASVRRGVEDADAGRLQGLSEVDAAIRATNGSSFCSVRK